MDDTEKRQRRLGGCALWALLLAAIGLILFGISEYPLQTIAASAVLVALAVALR